MNTKQHIIKLVRENPFLTVEELATQTNTTKGYVRNLLSEENMTLRDARKDEYNRLKRRYNELKKEVHRNANQSRG